MPYDEEKHAFFPCPKKIQNQFLLAKHIQISGCLLHKFHTLFLSLKPQQIKPSKPHGNSIIPPQRDLEQPFFFIRMETLIKQTRSDIFQPTNYSFRGRKILILDFCISDQDLELVRRTEASAQQTKKHNLSEVFALIREWFILYAFVFPFGLMGNLQRREARAG